MEDITMITDLIGSYGFPIVACLYMMISCNKTVNKNTEATNKLITLFEVFMQKAGCMNEEKDGDKIE